MSIRRVTITTVGGAHARPVAELARIALSHSAAVTLTTEHGKRVELSSILSVMDLALEPGDVVVLETAPAPSADRVLAAMAAVLDPREPEISALSAVDDGNKFVE